VRPGAFEPGPLSRGALLGASLGLGVDSVSGSCLASPTLAPWALASAVAPGHLPEARCPFSLPGCSAWEGVGVRRFMTPRLEKEGVGASA